jgi:polyphosphate kinase
LMPRNLDQRVEVLFPVEDQRYREVIINDILGVGLRDNVQARRLCTDGTYVRVQPADGEAVVNSQEWFLNQWKPRP